jgi:hypothetical protein
MVNIITSPMVVMQYLNLGIRIGAKVGIRTEDFLKS